MTLLDLIFQKLHAQAAPLLWHRDCVAYPAEFKALLASGLLQPAPDATDLPAGHLPGVHVPLQVRWVRSAPLGIANHDEEPDEHPLSPEAIARFRIDLPVLARRLRSALGTTGGVSERFDDGLLRLGDHATLPGRPSFYLAAPVTDPEAFVARCRRLHHLHPSRAVIVLTFGNVSLDVSLQEEFDRDLRFQHHVLIDTHGRATWTPPELQTALTPAPEPDASHVFRPDGAGWQIVWAGRPVAVSPTLIGLRYLHYLLTHPRDPVAVETLIAEANPHPDQVGERGAVHAIASAPDDSAPDAAAFAALRARRSQIKTELPQAKSRARERLREEFDQIERYLKKHGGNSRPVGKAATAKRVAVANAINRALAQCPPPMRKHFAPPRLNLGHQVAYFPDESVDWET
ncbi:hypothetical protein IMCC26134_12210 [Verrucomicrobia bacterium IMCC26134]|nr:hypothetical protein IMCC26134_12210 [Verrucomicrobia bacterium IMCC26134]